MVDLDLEKFFDRVNHDILMGLVARRVADKRLLGRIRGFLTAGVLAGRPVGPSTKGTPQGGPLSPLLSNLMLDVLDKELEKRGHRFVRYADDCNIYVRSRRAGERVMASVTDFLAHLVRELSRYLVGWRGYFGFCETPSVLRRLGVGKDLAARTAGSAHGPWRISNSPALSYALPNAFFERLGLASLADQAAA